MICADVLSLFSVRNQATSSYGAECGSKRKEVVSSPSAGVYLTTLQLQLSQDNAIVQRLAGEEFN